jgi:hypothetical protein
MPLDEPVTTAVRGLGVSLAELLGVSLMPAPYGRRIYRSTTDPYQIP